MSLTLPTEGQENWDEPLNAALTDLDERVDTAASAASDAAAAAQSALSRANHTGTQSADTVVDGSTNKAFTATEKTKLAGIETGATANSADANLLARANHTGTQNAATISDFDSAVDARVGVVAAETVRDTIGTALVAGAGISVTPDDGADTITVASTITAETIRDTIAAALVAGTNMDVTVDDAGDTITLDATVGVSGSAADYTPTLTTVTTNPTLGTGNTITGRYVRAGDVVSVWVTIRFGSSGASAGSGLYIVSLPVPAAVPRDYVPLGHGQLYDTSAGARRSCLIVTNASDGTKALLVTSSGPNANVAGHADPWAWGAGDGIDFVLSYEAAE